MPLLTRKLSSSSEDWDSPQQTSTLIITLLPKSQSVCQSHTLFCNHSWTRSQYTSTPSTWWSKVLPLTWGECPIIFQKRTMASVLEVLLFIPAASLWAVNVQAHVRFQLYPAVASYLVHCLYLYLPLISWLIFTLFWLLEFYSALFCLHLNVLWFNLF